MRTGSGPVHGEYLKFGARNAGSSGSSGVRLEQSAEAGGADDLAWSDRVVWFGRFVPGGRKVVASGVGSFAVVPLL